MEENFSIKAILSAIDQGFTSTLDAAAGKAKEFADGSKLTMEGIGTGMSVAGAAITALGTKSLTSFGQFEASLNQAAVVAGGTAKDIGQLDDLANKMGADLPLSAQDCADAMIEMARNGASISDIKQQFPAIAQAATAAGSDIKATAGVVQEAMNIWGKSLESPQQAAAILVQTANASNASVEDMSQALATIGGTANGAGMNLQTTSEAIGLLTNRGFSAAQASMDLNHAILQMQAPSKVAKNAMGDLGISFVDAQGKMKKFPDILRELNQALDGLNPDEKAQKLKAMFGTAGMQAIVPLLDSVKNKTNDAKVSWDAYAKEQDKAAGSTKQANKTLQDQANEMQKNVGSSIEQLGGNWESLRNKSMKSAQDINGSLIKNANQMLQWATDSNSGIAQVVRGFIGLSPSIGTATTAVGLFLRNAKTIAGTVSGGITAISNLVKTATGIAKIAAGVKTAEEALGTLAKSSKIASAALKVVQAVSAVATTFQNAYAIATGTATAAQNTFTAALLANPLTWIVVAIIAVVTALTLFFTQTKTGRQMWASFVSWLQGLWQGLVQVAQNVWNAITQAFTSVIAGIQAAWGGISSFFIGLWNGIVNVAKSIWSGLTSFFAPLVSAIAAIWQGLVTFVVNIWNSFIAGLIPIISGIKDLFNSLVGFFQALWNLIVTVAKTIWQGLVIFFTPIVAAIKVIWNGLKVFFTVLWQGIVVVAKTTWNVILTVIRVVVTVIQAIWKPISAFFKVLWQGILLVVTTVWNQIRARITLAFKLIQIVIKTGMQIIKTIFTNGWKILTTIISTIWKMISTIISGVLHTIAAIIRTITAAIRGDWSGVWNGIQSIISTVWNTIKSVVQTGINAVQSIVTTVMNAVKGVFSSIWNNIKSIFQDAADGMKRIMSNVNLFDIGKNIVQGLINGIKSMIGSVGSAIGDISNKVVSSAKGLLGIHSPSTVMRDEVGQWIPAGIAEGINSNIYQISDAAQKATDAAVVNPPKIKFDKIDFPNINSTQFSDKIAELNGSIRNQIEGNIAINNQNDRSSIGTLSSKLDKLISKDTTMVLDTGKFVGATTQKYDASLGRNLADNERWT